jgi:signal peptidase I
MDKEVIMENEAKRNLSKKNKGGKRSAWREYGESLLVAVAIALVIRALVIYPFRIPTGSMEDSLLVGDFLIANKFVFGLRSPDWIGIPSTKIGFSIPFVRTPGFRKPKQGDVVIFKYPQDETLNYIKRCIAVSGDTVTIRNKEVFVNSKKFPNPPQSKFINPSVMAADYMQSGIFPPGTGNIDNYGPVRIPAPGDTFHFADSNRERWFERFQIIVYEGKKLTLTHRDQTIRMTVENQDRWSSAIRMYPIESFSVNGESLKDCIYTVKNRHYFMMGDNRDNSLDSRYWGFLPERLVVGEALIIYFSWDKDVPFYRLFNKIRWKRILKLIR